MPSADSQPRTTHVFLRALTLGVVVFAAGASSGWWAARREPTDSARRPPEPAVEELSAESRAALVAAAPREVANAKMDHSHLPIQVPKAAPQPGLSLALFGDAMSGFNLELHLERYRLVPPPREVLDMPALMSATRDAETGFIEGHAHLYVNGEKVRRIYGTQLHLPGSLFRPGVNQVTVTLNNHGHMQWTVGTRKVLATLFLEPDEPEVVKHRFESFPVATAGPSAPH